jgi:hypothetical protein
MLTISPPSVSRMCRKSGSFDVSQPYRPPRHITGIASRVYFLRSGEVVELHKSVAFKRKYFTATLELQSRPITVMYSRQMFLYRGVLVQFSF